MNLRYLILAFLFACSSSIAQSIIPDTILAVSGEVPKPIKFTFSDLMSLPRRTVHFTDQDKHEYDFEGVDLYRILELSGIRFADTLHGKDFTCAVLVVHAADNYQVAFTLTELDPTNADESIILAYRQNGKPLSAKDGPLHVVCPNEKRHIRWVRQVNSIVVERLK